MSTALDAILSCIWQLASVGRYQPSHSASLRFDASTLRVNDQASPARLLKQLPAPVQAIT